MKTLNRRLLATLTPARAKPNPLLPPYAHSLPSRDPLQPPYAHSVDPQLANRTGRTKSEGLKAPVRFTVLPPSAGVSATTKGKGKSTDMSNAYRAWAESMLGHADTRRELWKRWTQSVQEIARSASSSAQIPQLPFHELSQHLSSPSTTATIRQIGSLIVRDVLPDQEAIGAARAILAETEKRQGRPVFWHPSLLAIRGDPSVLSANNQIMSHLISSAGEESYILADTVHEGLSPSMPVSSSQPWSSTEAKPISASLALTPLRILLPPSSLAVAYAAIAPMIRSKQSKISFYDTPSYLSPSNHRLIEPSELDTTTLRETRMPHIEGSQRVVDLSPGDVLYHAEGMPVLALENSQGVKGLSLPIRPLVRAHAEGSRIMEAQRLAFEAGSPPPHVAFGEEAVELEQAGREEMLGGHGARSAMGY